MEDKKLQEAFEKWQKIQPLSENDLNRLRRRFTIDFNYNSNHIEGSKLTHDQTRYIFETKTLGVTDKAVKVDDIVETVNHFRCIDIVLEPLGRRAGAAGREGLAPSPPENTPLATGHS